MRVDQIKSCRTRKYDADSWEISSQYYLLVALGVLSRLLPHPPNVTAIAALGLFAGARGGSRAAWVVPVLSLLLTDLWLGGYESVTMLFVYAGFAASTAIGRFWLGPRRTVGRIAAASVIMSLVFFILSNFGWWLAGSYPPTVGGLFSCYLAALPWLGASLVGDICFSIALIGSYDLLETRASHSAIRAA